MGRHQNTYKSENTPANVTGDISGNYEKTHGLELKPEFKNQTYYLLGGKKVDLWNASDEMLLKVKNECPSIFLG